MDARRTGEHAFDKAYFVGGGRSNYENYAALEPAIDAGFMPEVKRYADHCAAHRGLGASLDIGCAMGFYVERLERLGWEAHGIDISEYAVGEGSRRGVENLLVGSVDRLPHPDARFDFVTSIDVIEHVAPEAASRMVEEAHRVLKPGGLCFFATPNFLTNAYWNVYTPGFVDRDKTHVNYQSVESLRSHFADFTQCTVYGHTPFVDQFHAFETSEAFTSRFFRYRRLEVLARHIAWKLLGRSVEYSSYLHAVAVK
jgi:SAM-dependent methyltransferase